ncbi:helix-turn-helix transcriptional regulator [Mesorhizobium sp. M1348]|uniref:helix-turn-helix domain-containing protein n=1 Tax=unclassified Mesorhizobium TaxID=325217 RepID=UPI00333B666E
MEARKRVAVNVQRLRRERDLSQEKLGERANVHQTYLSQLEGSKRNPSIDLLERIAKALKVDIAELFKRNSPSQP